jgi:hypothetical protein
MTFTDNKISVSALSALSANLGTVNAGSLTSVSINAATIVGGDITGTNINGGVISGATINGSVIYGGSNGQVTIDSSGLMLTAGTSTPNQVKWTNGAYLYGNAGYLGLNSPQYITLDTPNGSIGLANGALWPVPAISLGLASAPWADFYLRDRLFWEDPPQTTYQDHPLVWSPGNGQVYRRTDGVTVSVANPTWIQVRGGLVVDVW